MVAANRRRPCEKGPANEHLSEVGGNTVEDNVKALGERQAKQRLKLD